MSHGHFWPRPAAGGLIVRDVAGGTWGWYPRLGLKPGETPAALAHGADHGLLSPQRVALAHRGAGGTPSARSQDLRLRYVWDSGTGTSRGTSGLDGRIRNDAARCDRGGPISASHFVA
jgi:hypothetical protein